jgi:hypothetical protein
MQGVVTLRARGRAGAFEESIEPVMEASGDNTGGLETLAVSVFPGTVTTRRMAGTAQMYAGHYSSC